MLPGFKRWRDPKAGTLLSPPAQAVTRGLVVRFHLEALYRRFSEKRVRALFMLLAGFASIAVLSMVALLADAPTIFPSLGATAFLVFFAPATPAAWPRTLLVGHGIGVACGIGALLLVGLHDAPAANVMGMSASRVIAVALSLATTGAAMVLADAPHPPAGATALIVSLGLITRPVHLLVMMGAVALLAALAFAINRLAGIDYPLWRKLPAVAIPAVVALPKPAVDERDVA